MRKRLQENPSIGRKKNQIIVTVSGPVGDTFHSRRAVPDVSRPPPVTMGPARIIFPVHFPDDFTGIRVDHVDAGMYA
ncbi:hypothetical protein ES703_116054 [subsurface metagenome]